jgi:hypothetical protein
LDRSGETVTEVESHSAMVVVTVKLPSAKLSGPANRAAVIRLVGARLGEQTNEWAIVKRYMSIDSLKTGRHHEATPADPRPAIEAAAG